jgi:hypothetical protein
VQLEGLSQLKNPMTSQGIGPMTFIKIKCTPIIHKYCAIMLDLWFYISNYEQYYLLECATIWSGRRFLTFWKNLLSPSSESKSKPCKPAASKAMLLACSLLSLLFNPEDEDSTFLRSVSKLLLDYTASDPRRQHSSQFYYFL